MPPALKISIALNGLLAAAVVALWLGRAPSGRGPTTDGASAPAPGARADPGAVSPGAVSASQSAPVATGGSRLTRSDIALLERRGIPRDVFANVVIEDYNRRSTQRLAELQRRYAPRAVPERELRAFSRQADAEQTAELKAALGDEGYRSWDKAQTLRDLNRARPPGDELPMSDAEAEQAYRLQKDYNDKARELAQMTEDGVADRADIGTLQAQAQGTLDRELEKLLGRERLAALRGQSDPTAQVYRDFGDLQPTAEQAQAVLKADADYEAREAVLRARLKDQPGDAAQIAAELQATRDAREAQLRVIFGAEAYDTQQRASDPTYQTLQQYAGAWNLKDAEVQTVYASLHTLDQQAQQLRSAAEVRQAAGQAVSWPAVEAEIAQARQKTEAALLGTLGAERLQRLRQNGLLGPP